MKFLVEVTEEDIRFGKQRSKSSCAIVRAIWRARPDALRVVVDNKKRTIRASFRDDRRHEFPLPDEGYDFVQVFDRRKANAEPFTMILDDRGHKSAPVQHPKRNGQRPTGKRKAKITTTEEAPREAWSKRGLIRNAA